jgi:CheY-like chemotaxis protein
VLRQVIRLQGAFVVEDDAVQRAHALQMLQRMGIDIVYEACDGIDALALLERLPLPPAVIVLDLDMPRMNGIALIQRLAERKYRPAIIIASNADSILINAVEAIAIELNMPLLGSSNKPLTVAFLEQALGRFEQSL